MNTLQIGLTYTVSFVVDAAHTASAIGSGDMEVLATPALLALMENASMLAVSSFLPEGSTTVGGHIEASHLCPTPIGHRVSATSTLTKIDGRKLFFKITANEGEKILSEGSHLRFIVDRKKFLSKI